MKKKKIVDVNRKLNWVIGFGIVFFIINLMCSLFLFGAFYFGSGNAIMYDSGGGGGRAVFDEEENAYLHFQNITDTNISIMTAGLYMYRYNTALIFFKHKGILDNVGTFFHELGHHYADEFLSYRQVMEWKGIYDNSSADEFVSDYANTSFSEDFAETFEAGWSCDFDASRIDVDSKRKWFKKNVHIYGKVGGL